MKNNNYLFLFVGKSGSGKNTIQNIITKNTNLTAVCSYTTRPKRYDDEDTHIFIDKSEVDHYMYEIVAETDFCGHKYFATEGQLNVNSLYIVDTKGINDVLQNYKGNKQIVIVYISSNPIIRFLRMLKRGDGIISAIKRIVNDHKVFKNISYDYKITNNLSFQKTKEKVREFIYTYIDYSINNGKFEGNVSDYQ